MKILVDADACPKPIKEILFRAAQRMPILVTLYANQRMWIPTSMYIKLVVVPGGFDVADKHIIDKVEGGDLVITADIPLAALAVEKDANALNPRGEFYNKENIQQILTLRNFKEGLRDAGQLSGGPPPLQSQDHQRFANALDRFLTKYKGSR